MFLKEVSAQRSILLKTYKIEPEKLSFSAKMKSDDLNMMTIEKWSLELIIATLKRENKIGESHKAINKSIVQSKFRDRKKLSGFKKIYKFLKPVKCAESIVIYKDSSRLNAVLMNCKRIGIFPKRKLVSYFIYFFFLQCNGKNIFGVWHVV